MPKEIRNPKSERKSASDQVELDDSAFSEIQTGFGKKSVFPNSGFGLRISFGFRTSDFGF
jgi:hypothetical protein